MTKGGRNTKIHAVVDELCRPWVLVLTPGNTHDSVMAQPCVSLIPGISQLLADKGYDSNAFRKFLKDQGIRPVILANRIARRKSATTRKHTRTATESRTRVTNGVCSRKGRRGLRVARPHWMAATLDPVGAGDVDGPRADRLHQFVNIARL